jgi:hypothetical protein
MITVEKATRNLQRKIRKVSSEALPDLLFIGTRNRSGTGRLDRVIDGLEQRLCKAMERGYPKIAAAAIIEKRRSQEPCIAAAAKAMAKRGAPNPEVRADSERPIAVQKVEPLTDRKSAARARRKANKNKLKAQQAEASAAEARDNLNKGADMDSMITIAKSVIVGKPSAFTKRDFFIEMQKRADQGRQPNETREKAFERYATADPNGHGQLLMRAHRAAAGEDYSGEQDDKADDKPVTNEAFQRLMSLAAEQRRSGETVEQTFARLYADPKNRDLVSMEKRMHSARVAKALGVG